MAILKINIVGASEYGQIKFFITRVITNHVVTWPFNF
jgi:hypothetical protein